MMVLANNLIENNPFFSFLIHTLYPFPILFSFLDLITTWHIIYSFIYYLISSKECMLHEGKDFTGFVSNYIPMFTTVINSSSIAESLKVLLALFLISKE